MKYRDPNQLNVFWDARLPTEQVTRPATDYVRVRDRLDAAAAEGKSLIRLQPGWGGSPWVIKQQTKNGAGGWRYMKQYPTEIEAKEAYTFMLNTGEWVEG